MKRSFFLDTEAQSTMLSVRQAEVCSRFMGKKFKTSRSKHNFCFDNDLQHTIRITIIHILIHENVVISEKMEILSAIVLFIVGPELPDKYKMVVNTVHDAIECLRIGCMIPLSRKHGHIYLELQMNHNVLYTYSNLKKRLRNYFSISHQANV